MIVISIINNNTYNINKGRGRRTERRESKGENKTRVLYLICYWEKSIQLFSKILHGLLSFDAVIPINI